MPTPERAGCGQVLTARTALPGVDPGRGHPAPGTAMPVPGSGGRAAAPTPPGPARPASRRWQRRHTRGRRRRGGLAARGPAHRPAQQRVLGRQASAPRCTGSHPPRPGTPRSSSRPDAAGAVQASPPENGELLPPCPRRPAPAATSARRSCRPGQLARAGHRIDRGRSRDGPDERRPASRTIAACPSSPGPRPARRPRPGRSTRTRAAADAARPARSARPAGPRRRPGR